MSLTQFQSGLLKTTAVRHAKSLGLKDFTVIIPFQSEDWGFEFHPDYHEVVNTVEIFTAEGCMVLVVNDDFVVIDSDWHVFSFGDC
jgi:hypothetical protein